MSDAPPPYSSVASPRPHSQPPPQQRVHFTPAPGGSNPNTPPNPNPYQGNGYQYPPEKWPQQYQQQQQQQQIPQQPPPPGEDDEIRYRPKPNGYANKPYAVQNPGTDPRRTSTPLGAAPRPSAYRNGSYSPNNYYDADYDSRDRDRSRSRSRSRERRSKHYNSSSGGRPRAGEKKKSGGVTTFLGAGGGAIIGDAIFPGLGTLGGAILGGIGGHEYTKKRAKSHEPRVRERTYSDSYGYSGEYNSRRGRGY